MIDLVRAAHFEPVSVHRVQVPVGDTEVAKAVEATPRALAGAVDVDADTHRFVVVAQRSTDIADVQEHAAAFDAE